MATANPVPRLHSTRPLVFSETENAPREKRDFRPQSLNERHRVLMRALATGRTIKDAAAVAGFSINRASMVVNTPLFQNELARMRGMIESQLAKNEAAIYTETRMEEARSRLAVSAPEAVDTIIGVMKSGQRDCDRLRAAQDLLDRQGLREKETVRVEQASIFIDSSTVALLEKLRARQRPVEVEAEVVNG